MNSFKPFETQPWSVAAGEMVADALNMDGSFLYTMNVPGEGEIELDAEDLYEMGTSMLKLCVDTINHLQACYALPELDWNEAA